MWVITWQYQPRIHYIDEHRAPQNPQPANGVTTDPICAVAAARDFFIIVGKILLKFQNPQARESGTLYRFRLPDMKLQGTYKSNIPMPKMMALNCTGSRLAIVGKFNTMRFIDLPHVGTFTPVTG